MSIPTSRRIFSSFPHRLNIHSHSPIASRRALSSSSFSFPPRSWYPKPLTLLTGLTLGLGTTSYYYYNDINPLIPKVHADGPLPPGGAPQSLNIKPNPNSKSRHSEEIRIDPATHLVFPLYLWPGTTAGESSSGASELKLVGLGVRTVSFLGVRVYSCGFYAELDALKCLKFMPQFKTYRPSHLLESGVPPSALPSDDSTPSSSPLSSLRGEKLMKSLLDQKGEFAIRIVPSRNTDFSHLRDGFARALMGRIKLAEKAGEFGPDGDDEGERLYQSVNTFKSFFPSGVSVPKGKELLLIKGRDGGMRVEYEGQLLGSLNDKFIAREMILAYFADKNVISQPTKESVALGIEQILDDPTMTRAGPPSRR